MTLYAPSYLATSDTYSETGVEEIVWMLDQRIADAGPILAEARLVRDQYHGDIVVPLPELEPDEKPAIANLLNQGLDQTARRISSNPADLICPPTKIGSKQAMDIAATKRDALLGVSAANYMALIDGRRARHQVGYGSTSCLQFFDVEKSMVRWQIIDPMDAFPCETLNPDDPLPDNTIVIRSRRGDQIPGWEGETSPWDKRNTCQIVTYYDDKECVQIALGPLDTTIRGGSTGPYKINGKLVSGVYSGVGKHIISTTAGQGRRLAYLLARIPNRTGRSPVTMSKRMTLERVMSQFAQMIGVSQMEAKLWALNFQAVERSVFPDEWIMTARGQNTAIITEANGRKGIVGEIQDGQWVVTNAVPPVPAIRDTMSTLERAARINANLPTEDSGESGTNIRTDVRGNTILGNVVNLAVRDAQIAIGLCKEQEFITAQELYKAHGRSRTFSVSTPKGPVEFVPKKHFAATDVFVRFALPGTDVNSLTVTLGQLSGSEMISQETARSQHPLIDDPAREAHLIAAEGMERTMLKMFEQQGSIPPEQGGIPMKYVAWAVDKVRKEQMTPTEAILKAEELAKEEQATAGQPGAPDGPAIPGTPQAQPGLQPSAQGTPVIPQPDQSSQNNVQLLRNLTTVGRAARQGG